MLGLVSNRKNVFVTHTTATTTKLIKKTTTPQSSNAENTNIRGLWCPCLDNEDTATVILTMQMQATRIDLLLAPSGLSQKEFCIADWWCIVDFG